MQIYRFQVDNAPQVIELVLLKYTTTKLYNIPTFVGQAQSPNIDEI